MAKLKKHLLYLVGLILIAIISHLQWFNLSSVISWGDWYYWPNSILNHLVYFWSNWISFFDLGYPNVQINFLFFKSIWSVLALFNLDFNVSSKITFFIPIALLSFLSPYVLSYKLSKDKNISFISAIFYGTTTYGLFIQPPIQFIYSLAPLVIYLFLDALEKEKFFNWLLFVLIVFLGAVYEPRIMLIVSIALFIIFVLFFKPKRKVYKFIFFSIILELGLNLFWILPTFLGEALVTISQITSRNLFGDSLFDISHSLTLYNWLWTGGYPNKEFVQQSIMTYFWIFPLIAFLPFLFKKGNKVLLISFGIISLLGIFLTKQSSPPFGSVYGFMYRYIPGFSFFREASKFYLLTSIGYLGLITLSLSLLKERKKILFLFFGFLLLIFSLYNLKPLITGEMGTLFVSRQIPQDYITFGKRIESNKNYFRTLWIPFYSRWSIFDENHPEMASTNLVHSNWESFINDKNLNFSDGKKIIELLKKPFANNLLSQSSVAYLVVPIEDKANDDNFFNMYGVSKREFESELAKNKFIKKVDIGTGELSVYETKDYKPHIYLTREKESLSKYIPFKSVEYKQFSPNTYTIKITNVKEKFYLNFSEAYSRLWKIRIGNFNRLETVSKDYSLGEKNHLENDSTLNSFLIDPSEICAKYLCKRNINGTYDMDITLYYAPQIYLYLGILSSTSLIVLITVYLIVNFIKKK